MAQNSPSRFSDKFMVRLPEGMREQLAASARANRRSMNAELVVHLEAALTRQADQQRLAATVAVVASSAAAGEQDLIDALRCAGEAALTRQDATVAPAQTDHAPRS